MKKAQSYFGLIFVLIILVLLVIMAVINYSEEIYCKKTFTSEVNELNFLGHHSGNTHNIKQGYIECCRDYYKVNEILTECKILPYD